MRKILFLTFAFVLVLCASAQAQNDSEVIKAVRVAYAAAKEKIKQDGEDAQSRGDAVVTMHYNVPATGPRTTVAHCFFDLDTDEDGAHYYPYFITLKYNVAAREYYEEYLFSPESGKLCFAFIQQDTYGGTKNEERYYYDDLGKLASANVKGERTVDPESGLIRHVERYRALIPSFLDFSY